MFDHLGARTLPEFLAERVVRSPEQVALVFEARDDTVVELTYAALGEQVARTAAGLAALGVGTGDKVVLHLPNRPELVVSFFALAHLGAVAVPSNVAFRPGELRHVAGSSDAVLVITTPDYQALFEQVLPHTPAVRGLVLCGDDVRAPHLAFATLLDAEPTVTPAVPESEAPVEILFTSGTTALPKGVVLTHANWLWAGERASHGLRIDDHDRLITALPLFHVNAQSFTLMSALTVGATAIFLEQYSASRFMDSVRAHRATETNLVAMLLRTLLAQPERPDDAHHDLRRVGYAINVSAGEKDAFEMRFGVELLNGYGLSEAMTEVTMCPVYGERRWPSIGQPAIGRIVRLVDATGAEVPTGEVGEITVQGVPGRTLMKEYYKDPEATAGALVDGWLHTGDNGYFDEDGYLYFVDRAMDIIKRAGENVSASEVERVLGDHPAIAAAAVIGVPDPMRDESVMAFVVREPGAALSEEDVLAHCGEHLAAFKVPTILEFCAELPMTAVGKIEKRALRERAAAAR